MISNVNNVPVSTTNFDCNWSLILERGLNACRKKDGNARYVLIHPQIERSNKIFNLLQIPVPNILDLSLYICVAFVLKLACGWRGAPVRS